MFLTAYIAMDIIGSIALIAVARKNPLIRKRVVLAMKLLVGDAYLTAHDKQCSSFAGHTEGRCMDVEGHTNPPENYNEDGSDCEDGDQDLRPTELRPVQ